MDLLSTSFVLSGLHKVSILLGFIVISNAGTIPHAARETTQPESLAAGRPQGTMAFSADGSLFAAADCDELTIFDVASGQRLASGQPQTGQAGKCLHLAFAPNGRWLVSLHSLPISYQWGRRFDVLLWEITAKKELLLSGTLLSQYGEVSACCATFSADSYSLVSGTPNGTIFIWECETRRKRLHFHGGIAARFSPDGRTVLALNENGQQQRFDASTGQLLPRNPDAVPGDFIHMEGAAFSTDWQRIAVWDRYDVLLLDGATGKRVCRLTFPEGLIDNTFGTEITLSSNGRVLTVGQKKEFVEDSGTVGTSVFDGLTGKELGWRKGSLGSEPGLLWAGNHKIVEWDGSKVAELRDCSRLLAGCVEKRTRVLVDPSCAPLEVELVARKKDYVLDPNSLAPGEFGPEPRSACPRVDLELRLRNTGKDNLSFSDCYTYFILSGPGAINWRFSDFQVNVGQQPESPRPTEVILPPGATYSLPVTSFEPSNERWKLCELRNSYWVLPGEYNIYATCVLQVKPAPAGTQVFAEGLSFVIVRSLPVQVRVVEQRE